ncbi:receptor-like protein kinase At5g59670 [Aegilops tauschii subsp. strangulata]|uniref:receptor-like protein kinase At5g59670 n=1 Tax=Aegilops tauschii subsp. strangulata TaxID=200361 RepID=UPI003CC8BA17
MYGCNKFKIVFHTKYSELIVWLYLSFHIWSGGRKESLTYLCYIYHLHDQFLLVILPQAELVGAPVSRKGHREHLENTENRRFTYKELEKFTNKFERFIGQGGFGLVYYGRLEDNTEVAVKNSRCVERFIGQGGLGLVYYGRLEDNTEVAVKMCSESSSHGPDEFLAEVQSLTKVYHRNLVSLVGFCWEKDHLALVYEYMSQGNLYDHLRGLSIANVTTDYVIKREQLCSGLRSHTISVHCSRHCLNSEVVFGYLRLYLLQCMHISRGCVTKRKS